MAHHEKQNGGPALGRTAAHEASPDRDQLPEDPGTSRAIAVQATPPAGDNYPADECCTAWLAIPGWPGYELKVEVRVSPEICVRTVDRSVTTRGGRVLHLRGQRLAIGSGRVVFSHAGHRRSRSVSWVVRAALAAVGGER